LTYPSTPACSSTRGVTRRTPGLKRNETDLDSAIVEDAIRVVETNVEATEAWNGPLFDIWMEYRDIVAEGLRDHGESALAANPPHEGDRVLDIGCGTRRCGSRASSAPPVTRTGWTSPSG
jgi:hypothetical protein